MKTQIQLLELSSETRRFKLIKKALGFKYGILPDKRITGLLLDLIIEGLFAPFWFMILQVNSRS